MSSRPRFGGPRSTRFFNFCFVLLMTGLASLAFAELPSTCWTWMDGSDLGNQPGVYGTPGVPHAANNPGARQGSATWTDAQGNLWLFGGYGWDKTSTSLGWLADLWKYNVTSAQWTWMKGPDVSTTPSIYGVYGTKGSPNPSNRPGARYRAVSWSDASGNFWLFGGDGFAASGGSAGLNDLWMYDQTPGSSTFGMWTWMSGTNQRNHEGSYGAPGVSSPSNTPPNIAGAVGWADNVGNLWLFGGAQVPVTGPGYPKLNALWKFDIVNRRWTWMKGTNTSDAAGVYGLQGTGTSSTRPGSRFTTHAWTDSQGRLWLFGGYGHALSASVEGWLQDLWRYDPATNNWTWMKGTNGLNAYANHGTLLVPSSSNLLGGMTEGVTWTDARGDLWIHGGNGYAAEGSFGDLSALWRYRVSTNQWTWMNGGNGVAEAPVFGTLGSYDPGNTNTPGGLHAAMAAWAGISNRLWLFGGVSYNPSTGSTLSSALWRLVELTGIAVTGPDGVLSNNATVSFGSTVIDTPVTRAITITNSGLTALSGLNVAVQAVPGGTFALTTPPASSLAPGASTNFTVTFKPAAHGTVAATLIIDDSGDLAPFVINISGTGTLPSVTVTGTPNWVWEDTGTALAFTFTRTGSTGNPLTVNFTVSGEATFGVDYTVTGADTFNATTGSVVIAAGSATASLEITPVSETTPEGEELVRLNLAAGAYLYGNPNLAEGTIASEELVPGGRDRTFFPELIGGRISSTAVQPDGKLVIGGSFTMVNGVARNNLARLNSDGTLDAGFVPEAINLSSTIEGVLIQSDGRIVICRGNTGIARFLNDGSVDPSFSAPLSYLSVSALAQQLDGKLIIGGNFTAVNGTPRNRIARLNTNGTIDTSFDPELGAETWIECIAVQPDGRILAGGQFTTFGGQPRNGIVRLNPGGTLDATFNPGSGASGGFPVAVLALALQPDGRVVIGGTFTAFNGQSRSNIARLESNGSLDATFNAAASTDDFIYSLVLQTDSRILLGGYFNTVNGQNSPKVARLHANGTFDSTFQVAWGPTNGVLGITMLADGRVLSYGFSSVSDPSHSLIARRANHPATQTLAPANGSVAQWQRSGAGPELERVTFDLSTDGGTNWTPLGSGTRIGASSGWEISGQTLPMTGHLRARGIAVGGYFSATSSIIEQVQAFTRAPEIVVEGPGGVSLIDGVSTYDYGMLVRPGPPTADYGMVYFSIRNVGNADLADLTVSLDGDHASDFFFNEPFPYNAPLAPGGSRPIAITLVPQDFGPRAAVLHIGSNDGDENSFDLALTGQGITRREEWRFTHFGSIANSGPGADTQDPDGDGCNNLLESFASLNPKDPASHFEVLVVPVTESPNTRRIYFTALPVYSSDNPTVVVSCSTALAPANWQPLVGTIQTGVPWWFIDDPDAGGPRKFYRVEISDP